VRASVSEYIDVAIGAKICTSCLLHLINASLHILSHRQILFRGTSCKHAGLLGLTIAIRTSSGNFLSVSAIQISVFYGLRNLNKGHV
jgi:hypothetical protein